MGPSYWLIRLQCHPFWLSTTILIALRLPVLVVQCTYCVEGDLLVACCTGLGGCPIWLSPSTRLFFRISVATIFPQVAEGGKEEEGETNMHTSPLFLWSSPKPSRGHIEH